MGGTWCQWCLADHAAAVGVTRACCLPHGFGEVLTGFLVSVVPPCLECVVPQAGGLAAAAGWVWPRGLVKGHRDLLVGGQLISLRVDRLCPCWRSADLLAGQVSGVTPLPVVASASRRLVPSVRTRWAWWR